MSDEKRPWHEEAAGLLQFDPPGCAWELLTEALAERETLQAALEQQTSVALQALAERDRLRERVALLSRALDAWLDWDRTAEADTSASILDHARTLTDSALRGTP